MAEQHSHTRSASVPEHIRTLVSRHAKAWAQAGQANNGAVFDPYGGVYVETAREIEQRLLEEIAEALSDEKEAPVAEKLTRARFHELLEAFTSAINRAAWLGVRDGKSAATYQGALDEAAIALRELESAVFGEAP